MVSFLHSISFLSRLVEFHLPIVELNSNEAIGIGPIESFHLHCGRSPPIGR